MDHLLQVENLSVSFHTYAGEVQAVRGVSFSLDEGRTLAIVGESGSGKTVSSKAVMGLIDPPAGEVKKESRILYNGTDITKFTKKQWQSYRGSDAGMIFQDPMTALDPTMKIGDQITEAILKHEKLSRAQAKERAVELLRQVNIPSPEERVRQYPYEFSGGMRQRVVIAIALACNPRLIIADEPTTALDVTIQAQIIRLLQDIQKQNRTAIIMITHDLGVVAGMADDIAVMYAGNIVESGPVDEIFRNPQHPYTYSLLGAVPRLNIENKAKLNVIPGTPPDLISPPKGCGFATRCRYCMQICSEQPPAYTDITPEHRALCWLHHPVCKETFHYDDVRRMLECENQTI